MHIQITPREAFQRSHTGLVRVCKPLASSRRVLLLHKPGIQQEARATRLHGASTSIAQEDVELPLEIHRLLQVNQAASRETCKRVVEQLSNNPPAVGFTQVSAVYAMAHSGFVGHSCAATRFRKLRVVTNFSPTGDFSCQRASPICTRPKLCPWRRPTRAHRPGNHHTLHRYTRCQA